MTETKYVYKCVWKHNERYLSIAGFFCWGSKQSDKKDVVLSYKIGKITKPKIEGSAIYAFDSAHNAKMWLNASFSADAYAILKCEYEIAGGVPMLTASHIRPAVIREMWSFVAGHQYEIKKANSTLYDLNQLSGHNLARPAQGTILCKWVKPINLIKRYG